MEAAAVDSNFLAALCAIVHQSAKAPDSAIIRGRLT